MHSRALLRYCPNNQQGSLIIGPKSSIYNNFSRGKNQVASGLVGHRCAYAQNPRQFAKPPDTDFSLCRLAFGQKPRLTYLLSVCFFGPCGGSYDPPGSEKTDSKTHQAFSPFHQANPHPHQKNRQRQNLTSLLFPWSKPAFCLIFF